MRRPPAICRSDDRGAVLVHVACVLIAMMALSTIVLDFGVLWVSRRQAQNAADAGALSGAVALALDSPDVENAKQSAFAMAQRNWVWGQAPSVLPASDITIGPCPGGTNTCVRVDVYRNQLRDNPLPMFFGQLIGLEEQGIRATATAMVQIANATPCLKPWGIPDKWIENYPTPGPWTVESTFVDVDADGNPLPNPDLYVPPSSTSVGSGFTLAADLGLQLTLKPTGSPLSPGFYNALQLTEAGADEYRENISGCANVTWGIGDEIPVEPGNMVGPTVQGARDLIDLDPNAVWVGGEEPIANSCVDDGSCPQYALSPRVVAVPVYDINVYLDAQRTTGRVKVLVRNIIGFFIEDTQGTDVIGRITTGSGIYDPDSGTVPPEAAFLYTILLVR